MQRHSFAFAQSLITLRCMSRLHNLAWIALAALALPSCGDRAVGPIASVTLEQAGFDTKFPKEIGCWTDNESLLCPLIIREDGTLTHQGVEFDPADSPRIESEWKRRGFPVLGIAVPARSQHAAADFPIRAAES